MARAEKHRGNWRGIYLCNGNCPRSNAAGTCQGHKDGMTRDVDGGPFKTRKAAETAATIREYEVRQTGFKPGIDITFGQAADKFLARDRDDVKASTVKWYGDMLRSFFVKFPKAKNMKLSNVTTDHVDEWLLALKEEGKERSTVVSFRNTLSAVCTYAVTKKKWITENPVTNADVPADKNGEAEAIPGAAGTDPAFTEAELWALADVIDPRYRLLVLLGGYSGLRISELFGLHEDDLIEWIEGGLVLHVARQFRNGTYTSTKLKKPRKTPVAPHIAPLLRKHLQDFPPSENRDGTVFSAKRGNPINYGAFMRHVWKPALEAADLSYRGTHSLRRRWADYLLENNVPLQVATDWGGWASTEMLLEVYRTKNSEADLDNYMRLLSAPCQETVVGAAS